MLVNQPAQEHKLAELRSQPVSPLQHLLRDLPLELRQEWSRQSSPRPFEPLSLFSLDARRPNLWANRKFGSSEVLPPLE